MSETEYWLPESEDVMGIAWEWAQEKTVRAQNVLYLNQSE